MRIYVKVSAGSKVRWPPGYTDRESREYVLVKEILTQLGTTAFVIAVAGYVMKAWITHQLERLKEQHAHQLALKLETVRGDWAKEVARLNVHEAYLHKRRVELIEEMHSKMVNAEFSLQNFLVSWWGVTNKEELIDREYLPKDHFSKKRMNSMKQRGAEFSERFTEINATLHKNSLYFDDSFIDGITNAYKPFFDNILDFDYDQPSTMPKELKDVVTIGQVPAVTFWNYSELR